jgi:DNA helicase-2/ATP-dependent DNA helicase PcrA
MNENEEQLELAKLEDTLQQIKQQLALAAVACDESQVELQHNLTDYWENIGGDTADEAQLIEVVTRQKSISSVINQKHLQLQKMAASPYFGRIDFAEQVPEGSLAPEPIYIGIASLTNEASGQLLVYDWRTPIASMFYDFERGEAFYHCPIGEIRGEITLKRQYKILHGRIQYMFDSELKIDDEILQEILGRSADDKMKTIVTSIQREQNRIIRDEGHRLLFVQGPAGSGKTSIALHRVAYLLYRERKTITANNIIIFSPNHIFSDYISNVLPEIGEENVLQTTFEDYIQSSMSPYSLSVETRSSQLEYIFSLSPDKNFRTRLASIHYKSSPDFETVIQNYLVFFEKQIISDYPAIEFRDQIIFSKQDWQDYYSINLAYLPPFKRIAKIRQVIQARLQLISHELRQEKEAEIIATSNEVNEKAIKALARMAARNELRPVSDQVERLTELNSPLKLYRRLFHDEALFRRLTNKMTVPQEWPAIRNQTLNQFNMGQIPYEDSFPLLYFQGMLEGFPANNDIKYLVVDEAQDYTVLQYKILAQLFPHCSWTIMGDPAQSIHPYLQAASFEVASQTIAIENPLILKLSRSYRSTREIQKFSAELLSRQEAVDYVDRPGKLPQLMEVTDKTFTPDILARLVEQLREAGCQSIAIICKTVEHSNIIYQAVRSKTKIQLIASDDSEFSRGTIVIPAYLAKGLEFDAVLIVDVSKESYGCETDRNILYTVCTRALHRLILCYTGELSPLIAAIPPNLYNEIK